MFKIIVGTLAAIALVTLATQYLRAVETEFSQQLLQGSEQPETIHIFNQLILTNTDEEGTVESQLQSPNTRYIVSEQKSRLERPTMLVYRQNKAPVKISAETATIDHQTNTTILQYHVDVSIQDQDNAPLRMTTELLHVDNKAQFATTPVAAQIIYGNSRMRGTGLELDLENKQVKFLNNVRGFYEQ